ncbi:MULTISPECIES: ACP S-malonyltransferase [Exiguobacterium]|uniref:Malonyl CoA-acyl carrier protein transacylase n=1 Tax=Exiguobacterium sibiricum (strain DSM 17290 / CCUG 55495 / CIP 109462 / JCM 13490 / 255-15) TaxID=262543 RepID=B1YIN5_EXIS2|nr:MULTISPECIES: ACP S-malonyltransferase [Exiguobacterium]ACB61361.1 malonyl CoA-acyl carrier protein transacylase [Exiguobacterium sibiricum 255-15]MCT4791114.1 ACP S-malonyltransferase [Exiguobacterium artemiae]MDW2884948.1 ACP S-malonyltransferase [Exiguobacterium sibiricum]MDX1258555.1 ACP S-malonyltransferase [Exiguobacterium sp. K1]
MGKTVWMFPGQGSQMPGMGQTLLHHEESRQALMDLGTRIGLDLTDLLTTGTKEDLKPTEIAQPAIVAHSTLLANRYAALGHRPDFVLGHSVGEYSALVAASVLTASEAVYLVRERGNLMNQVTGGTMAAVIGLNDVEAAHHAVESIAATGEIVQIANYNCPGQFVISGQVAAVETATAKLKELGAKRVLPLDVSGAFHSSLMTPFASRFEDILVSSPFQAAKTKFISNVDSDFHDQPDELIRLLVQQLYSPVRFEACVEKLIAEGADTFIEFGPSSPLSGLVKRIKKDVKIVSITTLEQLEAEAIR